MSEMASEATDRSYWEARVLEAANNVPIDIDKPDWVTGSEINHFIKTWYDLKNFYVEHVDTVIGLEVIQEFIGFMRLLRRIACDPNEDVRLRENAEELLTRLETAVEQVVWEAINNLYRGNER